jgi:hypothetical protein
MKRIELNAIQLLVFLIALFDFSRGFTTHFVAVSSRKSCLMPEAKKCELRSSSSVHRRPLALNKVVLISPKSQSSQSTEINLHRDQTLATSGCVVNSFRAKLRKRCKSFMLSAMVAVMAFRIGGARPVYASNRAALGGNVVTVSTSSSGIEILTKVPVLKKGREEKLPTLTLEDFERLRREVPYLPPNDDTPASSHIPEKPIVASNSLDAVAARNAARSQHIKQSPLSSKVGRAAPFLGAGFVLLNLFRTKVRYDREKAYVEDNIEKLEIQKAEYFNITGKSLSDDDLMESLANAAGNITLDKDDYNEEEDDEDEEVLGGTPKRPSPPPPTTSGGTSGGSELKKKVIDSGTTSPSKPDNSARASDDDIERMKRLFKK